MNKYEVTWAMIPTAYSQHRLAIVEADDIDGAKDVVRQHIKANLLIPQSEFSIVNVKEYKEPELKGRMIKFQ